MKFFRFAILALISAGCTVGPVYQEPDIDIPCEWSSETSPCFNSDPSEVFIWWECLQDPMLSELMTCAVNQNLDLKIAAIRVLEARAVANAKKGDLYPHIDASADYGHLYYSKDALVNGLLGTALPVDSNHVRRNVNFYEVGFDADWEIDFFGLTAHEICALQAQGEAAQESLCGVWVTLSAEIAKNYIELRGLQNRLEIAHANIDIGIEELKLTQELLERGVVNEIDYNQALAGLSLLKADVPPIEQEISRAIYRLSILIGLPPGELVECLSPPAPLPILPPEVCIGIPSELLRRRPDIRKAERDLAAATERIGSAIASLFPRFSLSGFVGQISTEAGRLFNPASTTWLAGPQVLVPIFNSKLILQDVEYNKLETQIALYTYQKTVLEALEESENAIASFRHEEERLRNLKESYQQYQMSMLLVEELRQRGINDNFALTKAKKSMLSAEEMTVQSQTTLLLDYVLLYKALGGSWDGFF